MKTSRKEAIKIDRKTALIYSYPSKSRAISVAYISINGRHPYEENSFFIEHDCHVLFYITKGKGTITVEGTKNDVETDDSFVIQPGKKYWIEGILEYVVTTTPGYYLEQNQMVTE